MPIQRCTRNGKSGYKWGGSGFCYIGPNAKAKAARQGRAIEASKRGDALSPETEILKRILAERQRLGKGNRLRKPPRWNHPVSIEGQYRRSLVAIVNEIGGQVNALFIPHLPGIVDEANALTNRDAWPNDIKRLFENVTLAVDARTVAADRMAEVVGSEVNDYNDTQWRKIVKATLGVNVFGSEPWLVPELESFAEENAKLITSLQNDTLREIETLAQRAVRDGVRHETIAKEIRKRLNVAKNRANLIARDQVSKLNGQLTQLRQTDLGVTHYIWRSADDTRVRPTHRNNDDKRFAWASPPSTGHPGHEINCRCWAEPDMSTIFDEAPEVDTPTPPPKGVQRTASFKIGKETVSTEGLPSHISMRAPRGTATSWVQTSTLNRAWKRGGATYVKPGGKNAPARRSIVNRLKKYGNNAPLDMPVVELDQAGNIIVTKGAENLALLRDLGVTNVPVRFIGENSTRFVRQFAIQRKGTTVALRNLKGTTTVTKIKAPVPRPAPPPTAAPVPVKRKPPKAPPKPKVEPTEFVSPTQRSSFVAADNLKDATERLSRMTKAPTVNLPTFQQGIEVPANVPLSSVNSILAGTERVLTKFGTRVSRISIQNMSRANGKYAWIGPNGGIKADHLAMNLKNALDPNKAKIGFDYLKNNKRLAVGLEAQILDLEKDQALAKGAAKAALTRKIRRAKRDLVRVQNSPRWSISTDSRISDPISITGVHESYHAVYHQNRLGPKFETELFNRGVDNVDEWYKVSEYAGVGNKRDRYTELFAETGAAIEADIPIPNEIREAFLATIKGI